MAKLIEDKLAEQRDDTRRQLELLNARISELRPSVEVLKELESQHADTHHRQLDQITVLMLLMKLMQLMLLLHLTLV